MADQSCHRTRASNAAEVKTRLALLTLGVLAACAGGKERADTTSLPAAPDTVKPAAVDTLPARADTTTPRTSTSVTTTKTTTKTSTPTATRDTNLGRDSVIRFP